ncbi:MAG: symmetrical bis(5'-nucleosyl)-tetraphosphatase [Pseudomonadota bacterium]|nr:MAG: symmetrical bis(5'-nucleosyl)-tetraphosphatase [Pseudomonadota bacterium]
MPVYAIGDIQGCYYEFRQLLDHIGFDAAHDALWLAGDLVNRGPDSLKTLRFVRSLGERVISVLGNHDLNLLAVAEGLRKDKDHSLHELLAAPDRDELLHWLRHRPLMHHDASLNFTLVHAGLPPQWDLDRALACARELEETLRGETYHAFLTEMYGNQPKRWSRKLAGHDRLRFICNCFTRLRYCSVDGALDLKAKGPPGSQPAGIQPWFTVPGRKSEALRIVFGHWSTLGPRNDPGVYPLDTGCVWGGQLTALRLDRDAPAYHHLPCAGAAVPGAE